MPITEFQKEQRRKHLGSSDAAAILGISPWKTPRDVYIEKTQECAELPASPAMEIGNRFEPVVIEYALERLKDYAPRRNVRRVAMNGIMAANLDCALYETVDCENPRKQDPAVPLEVKWASDPDEWGKESEGLDGVPLHYAVQPMHQMICTGAPRAFMAVCLHAYRMPEFRLYEIVPSREMLERLEAREVAFWREFVEKRVMPPDSKPASIETLSRVLREPGKAVAIDDALVAEWRAEDAAAKAAQVKADAAKAKVLEALGDAEIGTCSLGNVTFKTQQRKAYTVEASSFRTCRFSAAKEVAA